MSLRPLALPALLLLTATLLAPPLDAQGSHRDYEAQDQNLAVPEAALANLQFDSLNFTRGGRSTAVAGVVGDRLTYYFGASGGGVWKTSDAGINWQNVTDGTLGVGSVGAIAVAPSDPNVVYVGTGSACPRGNIANGDGMYRSRDAGATWEHIGLPDAGQIGRIRVHPRDPNLLYVAALGNIFGPNEERGLYRSKDGGDSWQRVHFVSDRTGFVDLAMDPTNPRVLYAGAWRAERKPWTMISGSEDGGVFKSIDGGDTWEKVEGGLPTGLLGKIGLAVSPANPSRVWALIEAEGERGGLYRSDDAGKSWSRVSGDAKLRQRPWYYTHVYADPQSENTVYVLNVRFWKSTDGGRTFPEQIEVPHGDNHDLWIDPEDPMRMVQGNDGGGNVSFDGGKSWSWQMNQPTAEIYRLVVDQQWPYRVYGSQQDNSTISIPSDGNVAWNRMPPNWYSVGGCESGHIAVDPRDPDIVYAGCYGGSISRVNVRTGESREIITYPQLQLGQAPRDLKYRFQWNAPIRLSPHDPDILYHSSQIVHMSRDEGQSWRDISPDLSTDDPETQDYAGGPISHDSTGVEVYNVIFSFEESPHRRGELWAGTDDGRVHVSRDLGESWTEVTPRGMPEGGTVNMIEISAHDPDRLFIAVFKYRENDFRPYVFRTDDGGRSWTRLTDGTNGIPSTHFVRVIREDPAKKGLLYAGTEFGLYVSFDDGRRWQSLQGKNLPISPITDLAVHRNDLVISTQGRSFWVLRDLSPLHGLGDGVTDEALALLPPALAYRHRFDQAKVHFWAGEVPEQKVELAVLKDGEEIRSYEWDPEAEEEKGASGVPSFFARFLGDSKLEVKEGLNTFSWNLRHEAPEKPEELVHWGFTPGVAVPPGEYEIRLSSGDWSQSRTLRVDKWPTSTTGQEGYEEQYRMGLELHERLDTIFDAIVDLREVKGQVKSVTERLERFDASDEEIEALAEEITTELTEIEEALTQVKSKSSQDPLNFPPMLDNQYVELYTYVVASDYRPTAGAAIRLADLDPALDELTARLDSVMSDEVPELNRLVAAKNLPAVAVPPEKDGEEAGE